MKVITAIKPLIAFMTLYCYGVSGMAETICFGLGDPKVSQYANSSCNKDDAQCCTKLCRIVFGKTPFFHFPEGKGYEDPKYATCKHAYPNSTAVIGSGLSHLDNWVSQCDCRETQDQK